MKGIIASFRQGRHTVRSNQMIIEVEAVSTREDAEEYVGKKVTYNTGKKEIAGKVTAAHGNSGALRVRFETGMPGQALGETVQIDA